MRRLGPIGRAELVRFSFADEIADAWEGRSLMLFQVEYSPGSQALTLRFQIVPGLQPADQHRFVETFRIVVSASENEKFERITAGIGAAPAAGQPSDGHETVRCKEMPSQLQLEVGDHRVELQLPADIRCR
jgi:hypothetical protein